ncbi:MAG: DUF1592 domain-containing protein [Myxococcota bacterium]
MAFATGVQNNPRHRWRSLVLATLVVAGCEGTFSPPQSNQPGADDSSAATPDGTDDPRTFAPFEPQEAGLRRLSRVQLHNAIRSILRNTELEFTEALPADPSTDETFGFSTELAGESPLGASDVAKLDTVALEAAAQAFADVPNALLDCIPQQIDDECATEFLESMLARTLRRPLSDAERDAYRGLVVEIDAELDDPLLALEYATATALQSPSFVYLVELGEGGEAGRDLTAHELASRLSFFLWAEPPDQDLIARADSGELLDREVLAGEVRRLLNDERADTVLQRFFAEWFGYDAIESLSKNSQVFPQFTPSLAAAMRAELVAAVQSIVDGEDFRSLFTSSETWVRPELARFYGMDATDSEVTLIERWEAEEQGRGCNAEALPEGFFNLCSQGSVLEHTFSVPEAAGFRISVRAYAEQAGSERASMQISVNGRSAYQVFVAAEADAPDVYSFETTLPAGEVDIEVAFLNDFFEPPANRDLIIDWVQVDSLSIDPSATTATSLPPERRGLLSRAGILAVYAKTIDTSPTTRGLFVRERLLCEIVPDPPPGVPTDLPDPSDDIVTNRQRVAVHTSSETCAACHKFIDPLGLALEKFDGIGAYREDQDGFPLDVTGDLDGQPFDGAAELGALLSEDRRVLECAVRQLGRFALGREATDSQEIRIAELAESLAETGDLPDLIEKFVLSDWFRRVVHAPEEAEE